MSNNIIQSVGTIVKKEKLASVENETNSRALILESLLPYPGYHGTTIPDKLEPESLFVVTKNVYNDERIIRTIQEVKKSTKIHFDAVPGTIYLQNNLVSIIRFKDVSYNTIAELIENFIREGIEFEKAKKIAPYEGIIRIRKFFRLSKLIEGIYEDMDVKEFFYLQVPVLIDWEEFEVITRNIKYNIENNVFDAAQTSVYDAQGLVDFVRIYDKNTNIDKLSSIRKSYLNAIEKL
ncbi:MAG: hypothetical protein H8E34_05770 [Bacteroidetes bacterium]|nr:hypothetical protein [Bacteroidota bacterium]MBL6943869.1 hypothetical protein [Bacteroidales bacterium]